MRALLSAQKKKNKKKGGGGGKFNKHCYFHPHPPFLGEWEFLYPSLSSPPSDEAKKTPASGGWGGQLSLNKSPTALRKHEATTTKS